MSNVLQNAVALTHAEASKYSAVFLTWCEAAWKAQYVEETKNKAPSPEESIEHLSADLLLMLHDRKLSAVDVENWWYNVRDNAVAMLAKDKTLPKESWSTAVALWRAITLFNADVTESGSGWRIPMHYGVYRAEYLDRKRYSNG